MNKLLLLAALLFVGCSEDVTNKEVVEANGTIISQVVSPRCTNIDDVYYPTQEDIVSYFHDTRNMTVFWDRRYGRIDAYGCSATITVDDMTPSVEFGGPQATLIHRPTEAYPWRDGNNLMVQLEMTEPIRNGNVHGGIAINFFIINERTNERLNYVISIHTIGDAWANEQADILYDPTTETLFISTTIAEGNQYVTMSPISARTDSMGTNLFRVNIHRDNLPVAVPEEWYLPFIGIQYELEESMGQGSIHSSFNNFSAYITDGVL